MEKQIKKRIESEIRFLKKLVIFGQAQYTVNERTRYQIDDRIKRLKDALRGEHDE